MHKAEFHEDQSRFWSRAVQTQCWVCLWQRWKGKGPHSPKEEQVLPRGKASPWNLPGTVQEQADLQELKQRSCPCTDGAETFVLLAGGLFPMCQTALKQEKVFPVLPGCTILRGSRAFKCQQELVGDYHLFTSVYLRSPLKL